MDSRWSIAVHGGAGTILRENLTEAMRGEYEAGLGAALDAGARLLAEGGNALDAVAATVVLLEDDPHFNAGRGATFTFDGKIELDAAIMDGRTRAAGAVAGVTRERNPVLIARAVMEHSPHVFLAGAGAERFAREHGFEPVDPAWFETAERRRQFEEFRQRKSGWFDGSV
jgi:beta-aspartyl-peptidase (threonine type)